VTAQSLRNTNVILACTAFYINQTCYRYQAKLNAENEYIADWLISFSTKQRNCGSDLCFFYETSKAPNGITRSSTGFTANWS
jgi:hypothetical protein